MQIPKEFRASLSDYSKSGYDRGHLSPAADFASAQEYRDSFLLTNVSPQVGRGLNSLYWREFERFVRSLVWKFDRVHVVTGPLFLPSKMPDERHTTSYQVIGDPPTIPVPTHFFKGILSFLILN